MLPNLHSHADRHKNALQDKSNGELFSVEFKISEELIVQNTCIKLLGIQIGNHLNWIEHVESVSVTVSGTWVSTRKSLERQQSRRSVGKLIRP